MAAAVSSMDADPEVGSVVITGSGKAFAAGADIREMASKSYMDMYEADSSDRSDPEVQLGPHLALRVLRHIPVEDWTT